MVIKSSVALLSVLLISGCGSKDDADAPFGLDIPNSIVTEAELAPGTLKAFDADKLKEEMENGGEGNYRLNTPDTDPTSCSGKLFNDIVVEAKGDTLRVDASLDFGSCYTESFKENDSFKDADFSELTVAMTTKIVSWMKCAGVDLGKYNGKKLSEVGDVTECNSATEFSVYHESRGATTIAGKIKNVKSGTETKNYTLEKVSLQVSAQRVGIGKPCSGKIVSGVKQWNDDCVNTDRSISSKDRSGFEGEETDEADVGKATYEKLEFAGLQEMADTTSPWYAGGQFNVTYQDWAGTVKFSSPTAEPIFEMKKGTETVTGTIKKEEDSADTFNFKGLLLKK